MTRLTYEPGSDQRLAASVTGGALTTFRYDATGRLGARTDLINGAIVPGPKVS